MRQELEQRFKAEAQMLPILRDRRKAEVVRWEFSTQEIWSYEDMRRHSLDSDILPGPDGAFYACGYDQAERPIVLQHFDGLDTFVPPAPGEPAEPQRIPTKQIWAEDFISYCGETLDVAWFMRGELEAVYRLTVRDQLLVEEEVFRHGVYQHTRFHYEGRRIHLQQSISEKGQIFLEIAFAPNGEMTYFRVRRDGSRFQLGQPLPKGVTVKSLKETIQDRLLPLVPQVVASTKISEPIYCVALAYDGEDNDALPPLIGIGLESEREHWLAEHGKDAWQWIWNPAEFNHYEKAHTQLDDDTLEEACDLLNSSLAERASSAPAVKLIVEVATALNQVTWPAQVKRTSDFVVYAVDFELSSLRKNLKTILAPEAWAALKAKKLI